MPFNPFFTKANAVPTLYPKTRNSGKNFYTPAGSSGISSNVGSLATTTGGGLKPVVNVGQGPLQAGDVYARLSITATGAATSSQIFDYFGANGGTTRSNLTITGPHGSNEDTILAAMFASNPVKISRVIVQVGAAATFTTVNLKFKQNSANAQQSIVPIDFTALQNPTYYQSTILLISNLNIILDGFMAMSFALSNTETLTLTFLVDSQHLSYNMQKPS